VHGWTHVNPLFWAPFLPVIHVQIISFVHLTPTKGVLGACCPAAYRTRHETQAVLLPKHAKPALRGGSHLRTVGIGAKLKG